MDGYSPAALCRAPPVTALPAVWVITATPRRQGLSQGLTVPRDVWRSPTSSQDFQDQPYFHKAQALQNHRLWRRPSKLTANGAQPAASARRPPSQCPCACFQLRPNLPPNLHGATEQRGAEAASPCVGAQSNTCRRRMRVPHRSVPRVLSRSCGSPPRNAKIALRLSLLPSGALPAHDTVRGPPGSETHLQRAPAKRPLFPAIPARGTGGLPADSEADSESRILTIPPPIPCHRSAVPCTDQAVWEHRLCLQIQQSPQAVHIEVSMSVSKKSLYDWSVASSAPAKRGHSPGPMASLGLHRSSTPWPRGLAGCLPCVPHTSPASAHPLNWLLDLEAWLDSADLPSARRLRGACCTSRCRTPGTAEVNGAFLTMLLLLHGLAGSPTKCPRPLLTAPEGAPNWTGGKRLVLSLYQLPE
ncbi:uncharacterized protein LOC123816105 isoform X1 [Phyllostomus hastatus]|uniref:uncharacterized protein LOC123816105 isoform X1 n=1 Tax=Phyllostomus hastatus TaxID=9423 RepID=UPI001E684525|nr:uncharacterized protein LOC123816105 isoform X1 [Phyllostomus hastatus]